MLISEFNKYLWRVSWSTADSHFRRRKQQKWQWGRHRWGRHRCMRETSLAIFYLTWLTFADKKNTLLLLLLSLFTIIANKLHWSLLLWIVAAKKQNDGKLEYHLAEVAMSIHPPSPDIRSRKVRVPNNHRSPLSRMVKKWPVHRLRYFGSPTFPPNVVFLQPVVQKSVIRSTPWTFWSRQ